MKKKVMVLAGGNDQIALMEELRRYFNGDVEILLVDMSDKVRAIPYADRFLQISTMDKAAVLAAARKEKIDYILTACGDQPLSTMAYVATEMGLPTYLTEQDVLDLTNKRFMKDKMVKSGIPTAKHIYINKDWDGKLPDFEYPLVVKPVDSNGSKGVKKVFTPADLEQSLKEAFQYSLSGDVIIEEFKSGEELSVDVYVEGTTAKLLSITASKKIQENKDSFTIIQSYYPAPTDYDESKVLEICQKIADAWHLHDTPLLVQMIQKGDNYNVLEFSARMGGGSKYRLIQVLSGVDIMKVYVEMVMGEKPHVEPKKQYNNAIMSYIYCYPGVYKTVKGLDELKADGVILDWFIYRGPDSVIEKSNTSSDRAAGFLVVGDSKAEVKEKLAVANARLEVLNDKGEDFMRHDLLSKMKTCVIGTGNGGQAIAGWMAMQGHDVRLYGRNKLTIESLLSEGKISLHGAIEGVGVPSLITTDIHEAVRDSDIIMVVTTANAHGSIAKQIVGELSDDQIIILNPGRTGGALEFKRALEEAGCKKRVYVAEAQTLVYACRLIKNGEVNIIGVKDKVLLSAVPSSDTEYVLSKITPVYPCFCAAENVLRTSLENIGAMFHPCVLLFNAATIERHDVFWFYRDMTPEIANFIEAFDKERLAVGRAYGIDLLSVNEWISYAYPATQGTTLCEKMRNNPAYHDIKSPSSIFTRQLTEDIPTGVLPIMELGEAAGVDVPLLRAMVDICSRLLRIDFRKEGRTLENLGLAGKTKAEIIEYLSR